MCSEYDVDPLTHPRIIEMELEPDDTAAVMLKAERIRIWADGEKYAIEVLRQASDGQKQWSVIPIGLIGHEHLLPMMVSFFSLIVRGLARNNLAISLAPGSQ